MRLRGRASPLLFVIIMTTMMMVMMMVMSSFFDKSASALTYIKYKDVVCLSRVHKYYKSFFNTPLHFFQILQISLLYFSTY